MEFENPIGKVCAISTCKKTDFLPFTCPQCKLDVKLSFHSQHCEEHKHPSSHSCLADAQTFNKAIVCPICLETLNYKGNEDPNDIVNFPFIQCLLHQATNCHPENYQKKLQAKTKKCGLSQCKKKLNKVNTFDCSKCFQEFCLSHRFPESHECQPKPSFLKNSEVRILFSRIF